LLPDFRNYSGRASRSQRRRYCSACAFVARRCEAGRRHPRALTRDDVESHNPTIFQSLDQPESLPIPLRRDASSARTSQKKNRQEYRMHRMENPDIWFRCFILSILLSRQRIWIRAQREIVEGAHWASGRPVTRNSGNHVGEEIRRRRCVRAIRARYDHNRPAPRDVDVAWGTRPPSARICDD